MALGAAALCLIPAPRARACGGFFCNQGQNPFDLPVAQTAENVLFAMERTSSGQFALEAHVQIFYTGPADRFSWVVPVDSEPTLGVGSNTVFSVLQSATQPRFGLTWEEAGTCKPDPRGQYPGPGGGFGTGGSGGASGFADAAASADSGVTVSFRGDVGPYDAAVIKSTSTTDARADARLADHEQVLHHAGRRAPHRGLRPPGQDLRRHPPAVRPEHRRDSSRWSCASWAPGPACR